MRPRKAEPPEAGLAGEWENFGPFYRSGGFLGFQKPGVQGLGRGSGQPGGRTDTGFL